jgi:hypothetical protein
MRKGLLMTEVMVNGPDVSRRREPREALLGRGGSHRVTLEKPRSSVNRARGSGE